jgi:hypothetical protein
VSAEEALTLAGLGLIVGVAETVARYSNMRNRMWRCWWVYACIAANVVVGVLALAAIRRLGVHVSVANSREDKVTVSAISEVSGLALLRANVFASRISPTQEGSHAMAAIAGSARAILGYLTTQADNAVRTNLNKWLTDQAKPLAKGLSFASHGAGLVAMVTELDSTDEAGRTALTELLADLADSSLDDHPKALLLVRGCVFHTSSETVREAIHQLAEPA